MQSCGKALAAAVCGVLLLTIGCGGSSSGSSSQQSNPTPTIIVVGPNPVPATSVAVSITVGGSGFVRSSVVQWNAAALPTTYFSSTALTAEVPASDLTAAGTVSVTVYTPNANPSVSNAMTVSLVVPAAPTITSINPPGGLVNTASSEAIVGTGYAANSTVAINGQTISTTYVSSTEVDAIFPAYAIATPGNQSITVTTPAPGGGASAAQAFTTFLDIPCRDIVYNSADGLLYASVPITAIGVIGNAVVGIDPNTGVIARQIQVGSYPDKLALSTDGTQLFVGIDGAAAVAQIDLAQGKVVNQFSLSSSGLYNNPNAAASIAAVPGMPDSVAVAYSLEGQGANPSIPGVFIFDSGIARSGTLVGTGMLSFGPSASTLYSSANGIDVLTVGPSGITNSTQISEISSPYLQYDDGSLYLFTGQVLNAATGALNGTFYLNGNQQVVGPIVSDSSVGRAFIATPNFNNTGNVYVFDETSFNLLGTIPVTNQGTPGNPDNFSKIVRWGQNGVAVLASGYQLFIFQSPLVKDVSSTPADLSVTLAAPATANTGNAISYVATVKNAGPNAAVGTTLSESLDPSLIINSITASQGSCNTAATFNCDLGGLANGASATVTVNATPTSSGTIATVATVSSSSYDPALSNNQATASTIVTGSAYNGAPSLFTISPNMVQAGSPAFYLEVNGAGFIMGSTVNLGGNALATNYVSANQLLATVPDSAITKYGWAPVTVSNPAPGGGVSSVVPLSIYDLVNVPANSILFDPYSQSLYATLSSSATGITGNSVVAINPFTGAVGTPVAVGSEPTVMTETGDGDYLYIGLSGSKSLAQFNLLNQTLTATIPLTITQGNTSTSITAAWLAAMPGTDNTLAVSPFTSEVGILDINGSTGSFRSNLAKVGLWDYGPQYPVFPSPTELYTAYDGFYRYSIDANGLTEVDQTGLSRAPGQIQLANGLVYCESGCIANPSTTPPSTVQTLPLISTCSACYGADASADSNTVGLAADPSLNKEFLLIESLFEYGLVRYDLGTYLPETILDIPASVSDPESVWTIQRFGQDGIAILSVDNSTDVTTPVMKLMLVRGPFVAPQELTTSTAASLTSSSASTITHGSGNTMLTLTGSNFLPGVAVTWNGSYRTTTIVDSSHVTVAIPASDLSAAGTASLIATNPGAPASTALQITIN